MDNKKLLTVAEAARALNLGRSHTYAYVMRGELESFKIGKSRRIPVEALDAFIARLRSEAPDA